MFHSEIRMPPAMTSIQYRTGGPIQLGAMAGSTGIKAKQLKRKLLLLYLCVLGTKIRK